MNVALRLLLIEDSEDDALLMERELRRGGFAPFTQRVDDRESLASALDAGGWDLVISDYSLPRFDGLAAFEQFLQRGLDIPFMFVSGHIGEERAVEAMRRGVSDYLNKDNLARLVPAIERELRDLEMRRQKHEFEAALRSSEARLRRLTHNAPDAIYEYALIPEPHYTFVSPAATRITGYTPQEFYDRPELWEEIVIEGDRQSLLSLLGSGVDRPAPEILVRLRHRDGGLRWVEQRITALYEHGELVGIEGIVRDVTERKNLEAQLLASQRMEAIGRLAGGIAHDFNNMLTVIESYSNILSRKLPADDKGQQDIEKIHKATERAASLVRQLLAFSRRQPRKLEVLDIREIISELQPMLERVIGEDVELEFRTEGELEPIRADRSQMEQIMMNLVVNARDAMPEGGHLTIESEVVDIADLIDPHKMDLKPGHYLRVSVSDTGTGIDERVREHIFDPFFTTKEVGKGTGLGLSTVYGIVKQMEGNIWVYTNVGLGTTFRIYLPCSQGMPTAPAAVTTADGPAGHGTILLVEDEALLRESAAVILAAHGYTILPAVDGEDALQMLAHHERKIDLLLTDVVMPRMTGVELAERVREQIPELSVLFTTGYTEVALPGGSPLEASLHVLQKPFGASALLQKVREALAGRDTPDAP